MGHGCTGMMRAHTWHTCFKAAILKKSNIRSVGSIHFLKPEWCNLISVVVVQFSAYFSKEVCHLWEINVQWYFHSNIVLSSPSSLSLSLSICLEHSVWYLQWHPVRCGITSEVLPTPTKTRRMDKWYVLPLLNVSAY